VQVAQLAGLPPEAIARAEALLRSLEQSGTDVSQQVGKELLSLDLSRLTGLQALQTLEALQAKLRGLEVKV
jgi:DNA mismatch repair ATPase MutS